MSLRKILIVPSASGAGVVVFSSAESAMAATPNNKAKTLSLLYILFERFDLKREKQTGP